MKKNVIFGALAAVVVLVALGFALNKTVFSNNKVLAVVDGHEITEEDFRDFLATTPPQFLQLPEALLKNLVMDQLISGILIDREVEKRNLAADEAVQKRLQSVRAQVLRDFYLETEMQNRMSDEAVRARYDAEIAEFTPETELRARHILVESEEEARAIIRQLAEGVDFAALATEKSSCPSAPNGGDLGFFAKGAMVPEFSTAAYALEKGAYTVEPVQTQFGWHVIKNEETRDTKAPTFEESKDYIRAELSAETMQNIVEELQKTADIKRYYQDQ